MPTHPTGTATKLDTRELDAMADLLLELYEKRLRHDRVDERPAKPMLKGERSKTDDDTQ